MATTNYKLGAEALALCILGKKTESGVDYPTPEEAVDYLVKGEDFNHTVVAEDVQETAAEQSWSFMN